MQTRLISERTLDFDGSTAETRWLCFLNDAPLMLRNSGLIAGRKAPDGHRRRATWVQRPPAGLNCQRIEVLLRFAK